MDCASGQCIKLRPFSSDKIIAFNKAPAIIRKDRMLDGHKLLATMVAGFLAGAGALPAEVICGPIRPLKPVRCLCGNMIDQTGGPAADITVKVIKDGENIATTKTTTDGTFTFGELPAGKYELRAEGFEPIRSLIVVARPTNRCGHRLRIELVLGYPDNCGSFVIRQPMILLRWFLRPTAN
jgi:hypothetical protein